MSPFASPVSGFIDFMSIASRSVGHLLSRLARKALKSELQSCHCWPENLPGLSTSLWWISLSLPFCSFFSPVLSSMRLRRLFRSSMDLPMSTTASVILPRISWLQSAASALPRPLGEPLVKSAPRSGAASPRSRAASGLPMV